VINLQNIFKRLFHNLKMEGGDEIKKEEHVEKKIEETPRTEPIRHEPIVVRSHESPKKNNFTNKMRKNPWIVSTLVCGIIIVMLLAGDFSGGITGNVVSKAQAGDNLMAYLAEVSDSEATLISVEDEGDLYMATLDFEGQEMPVYITRDGASFTTMLMPLTAPNSPNSNTDKPTSTEVPKSDKPEVELFIMTHCPYGTQAEKGILSTIQALGDTVDAKIRFVHYYMHENNQEEVETPKQVCIREEQPEKWYAYLECFLGSENSGSVADSEVCLKEVGIDEAKMNTCISSGKAEEYYEVDSKLSNDYGVRGSPSLVINGEMATSARDSQSYLDAICSAFNDAPEECIQSLSSTPPSPGFGWEGTGSASTASCN
jgi:hypothetical protein